MRNMIVATAVAAACLVSINAHAADESTTINGLALIDLTNLDTSTTTKATGASVDGATNGIGLDVTRFYVGVNHVFDDTYSANVTTDFQYSSTVGATEVFVKKAYLQAKFSNAFTLRAGSADMPWIPFVEGLYGYRYVAKTLNDLEGTANPADWGVHALGTFGNGVVSYAVSAVNGGGYKNPTRSKNVDFEGRLSVVPVSGLTFAVDFYNGKRGKETALDPAENTFTRVNFLAAYVGENFRVGAEYYVAHNLNDVQQDVPGTTTSLPAAQIDTDKESAVSGWRRTISPRQYRFLRATTARSLIS